MAEIIDKHSDQSREPIYWGVLYVCRRVDGMTHHQYVKHYQEIHRPLAMRMPGLLHYLQLPINARNCQSPEWDSVSLYVYPSEEHMTIAKQSDISDRLEEDSRKIMDPNHMLTFFVNVNATLLNTLGGPIKSHTSS